MRFLARALAVLAAALLSAQPALAQSVLRDAETEAFLDDIAAPLIAAAGLEPANVDIVLLNDSSVNAFVAGGQAIYVHSGLIEEADTAAEIQGVIAHELGHITGGHVIRYGEGVKQATGISLLTLLAGVGAALAGAGDAAMGIMAAGQQAALGKFLAFSRAQESSADLAGASYLSKAGISGRGSLDFFGKLLNMEYRAGYNQDEEAGFYRTHPMSSDRIETLRAVYEADPAWQKPDNPDWQRRFERVRGKLKGYILPPGRTLQAYPESDRTIPALYARAYAFHRQAHVDKAIAATDALLAAVPGDPYFLELKGQILLESGRPAEALGPLRAASEATRSEPLIAALLGHALIATEDPAHFTEAEQVLRTAVARDRYNPFAWYQLGVVYEARGDTPRARLASAEQQVMSRRYELALRSAQAAEAGLPTGTPDWLRAQDIAMEARALLEQQCEREREGNCKAR